MNEEHEIITPIRLKNSDIIKEQSLHRILQSVVPLDDGRYGYVYRDMGPYRNDRKYMCNVCKKVLVFNKSLITHHVHGTHKINCKIPMHSSSKFAEFTDKIPRDCPTPSDDENDDMDVQTEEEHNIRPGEPVPPGLEDVVDSVCQIQSTFDSFKSGPLVGLEYIVELISIEQVDAEPRYICLLCEKKGDPRSVMVHVTSYNHYLKYICCFFRTVGNKLNLIPKTTVNRSAINTAIIKVAEAIEKHYGRLKPTSTEMETFSTKKYQILREIDEKEHFRETPETTFLELVTASKMDEYARSPVVNFNTKDMELKNEELTKKCLEVNKFSTLSRSTDKKPGDKPADPKQPTAKSSDEKVPDGTVKKTAIKSEPTGPQNAHKKLCISLSKPERSIPGLTKPQVQNIDIIVKKEFPDDPGKENNCNNPSAENKGVPKEEEDDDVIIIPDVDKGPIEVESLSSVSSRSRSWSRPRNKGRSRSPHHSRSDSRNRDRRSRSRDQFGRIRRAGSRASSYEKNRDRDLPSRDRDRRDYDDRSRREYEERRRRRDYEERSRRGDSRGRRDDRSRRGDSRGHRDDRGYRDDRSYHSDSRGRRGDSRGHYDDRKYSDDRRRFEDERGRDWGRSSSPGRFKIDRRDKYYESEERSRHISEEIRKKNIWNSYKEKLEKLEDDLDKTYKYYQGHPEKHPSYNEEWKAFWNRRYKEIQMSGQDPSKYDFKPEWILFWEKKMKEIHEQRVVSEKEQLKRKYNLDDLQDMRDRDLQDVSPPTPENNKDITVNDIKKTWKALTGSDIKAPKREESPWETKDKVKEEIKDADVGYTSQEFFAPKKTTSSVAPVPPVIHSLRMLSVLEDQIGYLATRVIELLAQGLAMEKTKANHSMTMLQNKDIYLFFEAMKEKLRGQLMAGIVQRHLVSATRNVIKTIESMLENYPLKPEIFEPVTIPGVGEVDKVAVAQKIAGDLIKMGKTNVSQEELEQLINAVVGMANASSVSTDVSSDQFFSQLNIKNSNASSHINNLLNSLITSAQQSVGDSFPPADSHSSLNINSDKLEDENRLEMKIKKVDRDPSPFSLRTGGTNPIKDKPDEMLVNYDIGNDEDDDDYSFEDVYHAASEKLKKVEENKNAVPFIDENSQTQSSITSSSNIKNVTDALSSIDATALSNLISNQSCSTSTLEIDKTSLGDISKTINLNDLKSILNQQAVPEKPSIDASLIESIKDTLVQSFSSSNRGGMSEHYNSGYGMSEKPRERASMDPRNRAVWDPSVKGLELESQWEDRIAGRSSVWDSSSDRQWESARQWELRDRGIWEEKRIRDAMRAGPSPWEHSENYSSGPWESGRVPYSRPTPFGPSGRPPFGRSGYPNEPPFRHPPPFY